MANDKRSFEELEIQIEELTKLNELLRQNQGLSQEIVDSAGHLLFENSFEGFALCQTIFQHDIPSDFIYLKVNPAFERITGLRNMAGAVATELFPDIHAKKSKVWGKEYGHA